MSAWGKIGWGSGAWGSSSPSEQTVPDPEGIPESGHEHGLSGGQGKAVPDVYTVREFQQGFFHGERQINPSHVRAAISTFSPGGRAAGVPVGYAAALKAKTWAPQEVPFSKDVVAGIADLGAFIKVLVRGTDDLGASLTALGSTTTSEKDLPASISGLFKEDLPAHIRAQVIGEEDLPTTIHGFLISDISASLRSNHLSDLLAILEANPGSDINALVQTIPGEDLGATTLPIPSVDLSASGGGHFPEDITASLAATLPVDLGAYLTPGASGEGDLGATLAQVGAFSPLSGFVRGAIRTISNLEATIRVISQAVSDLPATLQPIHEYDLLASLVTQRVYDITAIVYGWVREVESNLGALIQRVDSLQADLPVGPAKAVVSTHTSDKLFNLTKVAHSFYNNRYVFGTMDAGLFILTLEPIFGQFPDLHAEIFAQAFYRSNLGAFVRGALRETTDLTSTLSSVVPFVNIRKLLLELVPLINMEAELIQAGGFTPMAATLTPVHAAATATSEDAGFVTTATSYRFYLGTSGGLFIPPQNIPQLRLTTYRNAHDRPDLHAVITGWYEGNLGASISDYPFSSLTASLFVKDVSRLSHLTAFIHPHTASSLGAALTSAGYFNEMPASISVSGGISGLPASIVSFVNPLATSVLSISTKPASNLGALINYDNFVRCSPTSVVVSLGAYLRSLVHGTPETIQDFGASLNALRMEGDLTADVVGRKRTRIRILSLTFRAKTRESSLLRCSITPEVPSMSDLSGEIIGLLHEVDFPASLTPVRFAPHDVAFTATEKIADLKTGETKDILVSFRSQVSSYVYEDVTNSVFATDRGTWAIDVRTLTRDQDFFDRSPLNRDYFLEGLAEFYTLDEAMRSAFVVLCERRQSALGAEINARGMISDLSARIGVLPSDRMSNVGASLVAVLNSPDLAATINMITAQSSAFLKVTATLTPYVSEIIEDISGNIVGNIVNDLGAEITVT